MDARRLQEQQGLLNAAFAKSLAEIQEERHQAAMAQIKAQSTQEAAMAQAAMDSAWAASMLKVNPPLMMGTPKAPLSGPPMVALVDGDLIAYRSAAATQGTFYRIKKESTRYYKDALRIALKYTKGDEAKAKKLIVKESNPEPLSHSVHNMKRILEGITAAMEKRYGRPVELEVYLTADVLFRDDVTPLYKKSREGLERPANLKGSKEWLTKTHKAQTVNGYEADDLIAMYATDLGPTDCVIVSLDKDLRQIPGEHYDFAKDQFETICTDSARRNFWTQALVGDSTDDIPGIKGVGPVTAGKILKAIEPGAEDSEFYKVVLQEWIDRTPRGEDEKDAEFYTRIIKLLSKSCKLLWLCREPEDLWSPPVTVE